MTGFGSVRWSDAMNQLILIALPTLPVLVTGAGEQARIASSNFSRPTSQPAHAASLYHSLENQVMFTCCIRYNIDPDKLAAFREYARAWISLINKYRGLHHGYSIPGTARDNLPIAAFSFPDLGIEGPPNVAVALFSFPSLETFYATVWPFLKMNSVRPPPPDLMRQNVSYNTSEHSSSQCLNNSQPPIRRADVRLQARDQRHSPSAPARLENDLRRPAVRARAHSVAEGFVRRARSHRERSCRGGARAE